LFVFNIAEYLDEENKIGFLPSLLDEVDVPHLGSSAESVAIGLNKARTKAVLRENGIPTPRSFVVNDQVSNTSAEVNKIGFPFIVKPIEEGGHIGIREDSIVYDDVGLNRITNRVLEQHNQPALVEEFITGAGMREFSVGIIDGETRLFTPIEIDFKAMNVKNEILSFELAQQDFERTKRVLDQKIHDEIIHLAERTFDVVGANDYSRVDLRMNDTGCYVLEINIMPGLGPNSFLPQAAKDLYGLQYSQFVQKLVHVSTKRHKIKTKW